ncbi:MAG: hypothetical protein Q8P18_21590 [Pseudomonadota bacterium]|nr:hypothetical protein [Pseudomonadota bacterium]
MRERGCAAIEAAAPLLIATPPVQRRCKFLGIRWMLVATATAIGIPCVLAVGMGEAPPQALWNPSLHVVLLDQRPPRRAPRPRVERVESVGEPDAAAFLDALFSPAERQALLFGGAS